MDWRAKLSPSPRSSGGNNDQRMERSLSGGEDDSVGAVA